MLKEVIFSIFLIAIVVGAFSSIFRRLVFVENNFQIYLFVFGIKKPFLFFLLLTYSDYPCINILMGELAIDV